MAVHRFFGQVDVADVNGLTDALNARVLGSDPRLSVKPYPVVNLTDASTIATNAALGTHFRVTISTNRILGTPTNPTDGQVCTWEVTAASGASRTLTLTTGSAGSFLFGSDINALSPIASARTDYIQGCYDLPAQRWHVIGYVKGY